MGLPENPRYFTKKSWEKQSGEKSELSESYLIVLIKKEIKPFQPKVGAAPGLLSAFSYNDHIELISNVMAPKAGAATCFHIFSP